MFYSNRRKTSKCVNLKLNHLLWILLPIISFNFLFPDNILVSFAQVPAQKTQWNQPILIPSPEETSSWFPDLAIDSHERVHIVWNETDHFRIYQNPNYGESVYYSMWNGQEWSPYIDIVPPQLDIIRNALVVDSNDVLHFTFGWLQLNYKQVQANKAFSASNWAASRMINTREGSYMSDIAIYQNELHLVYDDSGDSNEASLCPAGCADIFYRTSRDGGQTWLAPIPLFPTDAGSARAQIEIDQTGVILVSWDEGWDRLSGVTVPNQYGVFTYSADGGNTWSDPTLVSYPNSTNLQLTVGSNGEKGVMLVWRTNSEEYPGIYYMWSTDQGQSWAPPQTLPDIVARIATTPFDIYDMATDSAGHIHLLVVGHLTGDLDPNNQKPPGLYHFEWDGENWSKPIPLYEGTWYPEYPHLVVHGGNQLHATWFIRQDLFDATEPHQIWYAHGQSQAPAEAPITLPTVTPAPSPTPATLTPTAVAEIALTPTLDPALTQVSIPSGATQSIYTDTDELLLLAKSLIPAALIIVAVVVAVRLWRR